MHIQKQASKYIFVKSRSIFRYLSIVGCCGGRISRIFNQKLRNEVYWDLVEVFEHIEKQPTKFVLLWKRFIFRLYTLLDMMIFVWKLVRESPLNFTRGLFGHCPNSHCNLHTQKGTLGHFFPRQTPNIWAPQTILATGNVQILAREIQRCFP